MFICFQTGFKSKNFLKWQESCFSPWFSWVPPHWQQLGRQVWYTSKSHPTCSMHWATRQPQFNISLTYVNHPETFSLFIHLSWLIEVSLQASDNLASESWGKRSSGLTFFQEVKRKKWKSNFTSRWWYLSILFEILLQSGYPVLLSWPPPLALEDWIAPGVRVSMIKPRNSNGKTS